MFITLIFNQSYKYPDLKVYPENNDYTNKQYKGVKLILKNYIDKEIVYRKIIKNILDQHYHKINLSIGELDKLQLKYTINNIQIL